MSAEDYVRVRYDETTGFWKTLFELTGERHMQFPDAYQLARRLTIMDSPAPASVSAPAPPKGAGEATPYDRGVFPVVRVGFDE